MSKRSINLRLSEDELAAIDAARGMVAREPYVRKLLADAVASSGVAITGAAQAAAPAREQSVTEDAPRRGRMTLAQELEAGGTETPPPKIAPRRAA